MEIAEGVYFYSLWEPYRWRLGRGASSGIFAINQGDEIWLIDAGTAVMKRNKHFQASMRADGLDPTKISKIFLTHAHGDHMNAIPAWQKQKNDSEPCEIYISPQDTMVLEGDYKVFWDREEKAMEGLWKEFFPLPKWFVVLLSFYPMGSHPEVKTYTIIENGDIIKGDRLSLQVISTPGHTPGHLSYYIPEMKILFTGDLMDPEKNYKPPINSPTCSFQEFTNSLKKINSIDVEILCPAHAKIIVPGTTFYQEAIEKTLENLDYAKSRTIELLQQPEGIRLKEFNKKFTNDVWGDYPEQITVPFSIIKMLRDEGKIKQDGNRFYYQS